MQERTIEETIFDPCYNLSMSEINEVPIEIKNECKCENCKCKNN